MNKHIVMHSNGDEPFVFCGRTPPANQDTVNIRAAVLSDDKEVCKSCLKAAIRKLQNKL